MGGKSSYFANKVLGLSLSASTFTAPAVVWSALFTVIPSFATGGTEVTNASSGYTRVTTAFCTSGITASGQSVNTAAVTFATAAAGYTVVGWALMDTSTVAAGNEFYWATVTTLALAIGDQATFAATTGITITEA